jgi:hypothetical protein
LLKRSALVLNSATFSSPEGDRTKDASKEAQQVEAQREEIAEGRHNLRD